MHLFVHCPSGTIVSVLVDRHSSIADLESQLCAKGVSSEECYFSVGGRLLAREISLEAYGLHESATVHLCGRVRGGVTNLYNFFNMKINQKMLRDQGLRERVARAELKRKAVKSISIDQRLNENIRMAATMRLARMSRMDSATRIHDYCWATGRSRGIVRPFGLCRQVFRKLALNNLIPGVKKASW